MLAASNVPAKEVMQRAGHKKLETTMKYYINSTSTTRILLLSTINNITTNEMEVKIIDSNDQKQLVKESTYIKMQIYLLFYLIRAVFQCGFVKSLRLKCL